MVAFISDMTVKEDHSNCFCFYIISIIITDLKAEYTETSSGPRLKIPHELYKQGCVETVEDALTSAQKIGFPVMIKASEGGGGKGIRKAESEDNFPALFRQVSFDYSRSNFSALPQSLLFQN